MNPDGEKVLGYSSFTSPILLGQIQIYHLRLKQHQFLNQLSADGIMSILH